MRQKRIARVREKEEDYEDELNENGKVAEEKKP